MSTLGRALFEPAVKPGLLRGEKLGPMHHSVPLQREAHLQCVFHRPCWKWAETPLFGAGSASPWFWGEGPGAAEDFPR